MRPAAWMLGLACAGVSEAAEVTSPVQITTFEDIAATSSDEDLNDVTVRGSTQCDFEPGGDLVRVSWSLTAVAAGASQTSGLLVRLPSTFPTSTVTIDRDGARQVAWLDGGQAIEVWQDFRGQAFVGAPAGFVNTTPGATLATGLPVLVTVEPWVPVALAGACPEADLSIQPSVGGLIGLGTTIGANHRPLAGRFDGPFETPIERTSIAEAYAPYFLAWVEDVLDGTCATECGGTMWYDQPVPGLAVERPDLATEAPLPSFETCTDDTSNQGETLPDCGDPSGVCPPCAGCSALAFDGVNDYARMSATTTGTALGANTPWTVEGWFRVDALPTNTGDGTELALLVGPTCGWWDVLLQPDGKLYYYRWPTGCTGTTAVTPGSWHHFAVTGERASGTTYALYLDGSLECAGTSTSSEPAGMDGEWIQLGARSDLCLSEGNTPNASRWFYDGALKGLRFSDTVRYTAPFTPPGVLTADASTRILWTFDEGSGTVLDDTAGVSHDADIQGATWQSDGPYCGRVAPGDYAAITFPSDEVYGPAGTSGSTHGWSFVPSVDLTVTSIGIYDVPDAASGVPCVGLCQEHTVTIWNASGALVGSVLVPAGDTATHVGRFRYVEVTPFVLQAGETYVAGAYYPNHPGNDNDGLDLWDPTVVFGAGLGSIDGVWGNGTGMPTNGGPPVRIGPSFQYTVQ